MTDLTPVSELTPVPQLETNTLALGGTGNPMNLQAQALLNRVQYLLESLESTDTSLSELIEILGNDSDPAKGSAFIGRASQVVQSIAALRQLLKGAASNSAFVLGYYAPSDGGGGNYYLDPLDTTTPDNGGTVIVAADGGRWKLATTSSVSVRQFGAKGDGTTDDAPAIYAAVASGASEIRFPSGQYFMSGAPTFTSLTGVTFRGESAATTSITWGPTNFAIKSCTETSFLDIGFSPIPDDNPAQFSPMWVSNGTNVSFERCDFRNFGSATVANKAGSVCLYVYAGDVTQAHLAPGDTSGTRIVDCNFFGNSRKTNFGVRIYTEFNTLTTAKNTGAIVTGCSFGGFNWNAVEIAGLQTSHVIVSNCVANLCGLTPFDFDKGVHHCVLSNVTINRLLGNIDLDVNPNTRTACFGVQGVAPDSGYAYANIVTGVTAYLRKADLDAYGNGAICCFLAYCHSNQVSNINVYCDGVPARPSGKLFGLAVATFETASGNSIKDIVTTNASSGIVQTAIQNAAMTSPAANVFENIRNIGVMTGEIVLANYGAQSGAFFSNVFKGLNLSSDMSSPFVTGFARTYALNFQASGSSSHFARIIDSYLGINTLSTSWLVLDQIPSLSLENVAVNEGGSPLLATRFIHSEGSALPINLGLKNVRQNFGRTPLDLSTSLQFLDQTALIYDGLNEIGLPSTGDGAQYSSAIPTYPPAANWTTKVERITKVANSNEGWLVVTSAWKTYGTVSA